MTIAKDRLNELALEELNKMNKEQIIELAKQACDKDKVDAWHNGFWTITQEELERFAQLIRNQTLESAAEICDNVHPLGNINPPMLCAKLIRDMKS